MTHGDFDPEYLRALVLGPGGRPRLRRVSFAAHFDSLMRGRRGAPRPHSEAELSPFRAGFVKMFTDLRREHGVRSYLAHNMTVTPANLDQVAGVVADVSTMGYSMMSFQPAAFVGDDRRWKEGYRDVDIDAVWAQIESGMGQKIAWEAVHFGDTRCNRTAFGFLIGSRWVPFLDPRSPGDLTARDRFFAHLGGVNFSGTPPLLLAGKLARVAVHHPGDVRVFLAWAARASHRSGGLAALTLAAARRQVSAMTFEVHKFMDAADVAPAWELMQAGQVADDPAVRATQERLAACSYTMAHPETGQLVPACAQHSVLDPSENRGLRRLLPLTVVS